jgi:hypothetical protein
VCDSRKPGTLARGPSYPTGLPLCDSTKPGTLARGPVGSATGLPLCDSSKPGTLARGPVGSDPSFFAPKHQDVTHEILGTDSSILCLYSVLRVVGKPVGQKQTRFGDIGQWGHDAWRFRKKSFIVYLAVDGKPIRQEQPLLKQKLQQWKVYHLTFS